MTAPQATIQWLISIWLLMMQEAAAGEGCSGHYVMGIPCDIFYRPPLVIQKVGHRGPFPTNAPFAPPTHRPFLSSDRPSLLDSWDGTSSLATRAPAMEMRPSFVPTSRIDRGDYSSVLPTNGALPIVIEAPTTIGVVRIPTTAPNQWPGSFSPNESSQSDRPTMLPRPHPTDVSPDLSTPLPVLYFAPTSGLVPPADVPPSKITTAPSPAFRSPAPRPVQGPSPIGRPTSLPQPTALLQPPYEPTTLAPLSDTDTRCSTKEGGSFGELTGDPVVVTFRYELETNPALQGDVVADVLPRLEQAFSDALLPTLFKDRCPVVPRSSERRLTQRRWLGVTGVISRPDDLVLAKPLCTLVTIVGNECRVVGGELTLFIATARRQWRRLDTSVDDVLETLKAGMDNDSFLYAHVSIARVSFVEVMDDDDYGNSETPIKQDDDLSTNDAGGTNERFTGWVIAVSAAGASLVLFGGLAYRRQQRAGEQIDQSSTIIEEPDDARITPFRRYQSY